MAFFAVQGKIFLSRYGPYRNVTTPNPNHVTEGSDGSYHWQKYKSTAWRGETYKFSQPPYSCVTLASFPVSADISDWNLFLHIFAERVDNSHLLLYTTQGGKHQLEFLQKTWWGIKCWLDRSSLTRSEGWDSFTASHLQRTGVQVINMHKYRAYFLFLAHFWSSLSPHKYWEFRRKVTTSQDLRYPAGMIQA